MTGAPLRCRPWSPASARILVVEDEPRLGDLVRLYLEREGHAVTVVTDGRAAIAAFDPRPDAVPIDLVVLDLMLPGLSGEAVLAAIRERGDTPVLIASAKRSDVERIAGLRHGCRRLPRQAVQPARTDGPGRGDPPAQPAGGADAAIDPADARSSPSPMAGSCWTRRAGASRSPRRPTTRRRGPTGRLTPGEAGLLLALARQPGAVLSRDQLLDASRGGRTRSYDRVVDVHVANLRRKLGDDAGDPWLIETIPQTGYRLIAVADAETA